MKPLIVPTVHIHFRHLVIDFSYDDGRIRTPCGHTEMIFKGGLEFRSLSEVTCPDCRQYVQQHAT